MSLFAELKRRNVFRVGLAYVVAGWLVLQVTDVLMQLLGLPAVTGPIVFAVVALGFIPALAFAWAYELTPEGLKRDSEVRPEDSAGHVTARRLDKVTIGLLVAVAALVVVDRLVPEREMGSEPFSQTAVQEEPKSVAEPNKGSDPVSKGSVAGDSPSVAVLPFANMSPDPDNEYFADGIAEELLNLLVDVEGLRVPSRTSSFAFKGTKTEIREIAGQLQVQHVVEGSVRKAGNRVRVTAQLIDVATDTHLWSETYDRELEDIFAIQDEIAGNILDALRVALDLPGQTPPTSNMDAYTLYLQGRELLRRRGEAQGRLLLDAEQLLRQAVALDPDFAEAWAARALVQVLTPAYVKVDAGEYLGPALEYAERALAIAPGQADALIAVAQVRTGQGRDADAMELFASAVEQHPRHSTARLWYAILLLNAGYAQEAFEQITTARELDPAHAVVLDWYARTASIVGRPDLMVEPATQAIRLGRPQGRVSLQYEFLHSGTLADMEPYLDGGPEEYRSYIQTAFELRSDPSQLPRALAWADEAGQGRVGFYAQYYRMTFLAVAGTPEEFFRQVSRVREIDDTADITVWTPLARRHRQSDSMRQWADETGYLALWRERGWPDFCRPTTGDDFECE